MRFWKYSPGKGACYWNYCYEKGLVAIGWSMVGSLSSYDNPGKLSSAFRKSGWASGLWNTGDTQLWNFKDECKKGDKIVAYGGGLILSVGDEIGEYYYDEDNLIDKEEDVWYSHRRKVRWLPRSRKDISDDKILYGNPPDKYGILNKQLTFYEITDEYTIKHIKNLISL
jgi:5-methylcytosine-specific restriction protein B